MSQLPANYATELGWASCWHHGVWQRYVQRPSDAPNAADMSLKAKTCDLLASAHDRKRRNRKDDIAVWTLGKISLWNGPWLPNACPYRDTDIHIPTQPTKVCYAAILKLCEKHYRSYKRWNERSRSQVSPWQESNARGTPENSQVARCWRIVLTSWLRSGSNPSYGPTDCGKLCEVRWG